jgi:hypothetical protein
MQTMLTTGNPIVLSQVSFLLLVTLPPVVWISKHQGSIQALTYVAEFNAMHMPSKRSCPFATLSIPLECLLPARVASLVTL